MAWVVAVDVEMCFTHAISAGISSWQAECSETSAAFVFPIYTQREWTPAP